MQTITFRMQGNESTGKYVLSLGEEQDGNLFLKVCVCVCVFRAAPAAYGGSQFRGRIGAVAASLHHSHSNARSEPRL